MSAHRLWTQDAWRLVQGWTDIRNVPRLESPVAHRWQSDDNRETTTVVAWSGNEFEASWVPYIHECIREACVSDRGIWRWQWPTYREAIASFFGNRRKSALFNVILITPSRVPRFLWVHQGRPPLHELMQPNPSWVEPARRSGRILLPDLSFRFEVPMGDLVWANRPGVRPRDLGLAVVDIRRRCRDGSKLYRISMGRIFEANRELDAGSFIRGEVPTIQGLMDGTGLATRTHAPMIQLIRLDHHHQIDLVMFETSRDSGQLADIRWSRQSFESFVVLDPYFGPAILETVRYGKRLIAR